MPATNKTAKPLSYSKRESGKPLLEAMSDSREASPDWLREFQAPVKDVVTLSSGSDSSAGNSLAPAKSVQTSQEKQKTRRSKKKSSSSIDVGEDGDTIVSKKPKSSKSKPDQVLSQDVVDEDEMDPMEEDIRDKPSEPPVTSRLPLVFPDKVQRSKALVECDGDSIDLSGDVGAVGRLVLSNGDSGNHEMLLDLKGTIYKSRIVPSRTFCIVNVGQSEAKVEAILNDFIQLEPQSNVFEAETMVEGDLGGFSFDSEEEIDKLPKPSSLQSDQDNENEDHNNPKTKGKDALQKKTKPASRAAKKGGRKVPVSRKGKKSKK